MSRSLRTALNVVAVLSLAFGLMLLDRVSDWIANSINAFSETKLWVAFATMVHVRGAENEEDLMLLCYGTFCLIISIGVVYVFNKLIARRRRLPVARA